MNAAPALKGLNITAENENSAPLIIVEGKKVNGATVLTQTVLSSSGREAAPVVEGATFSGTFEGIKVKKSDNYPDQSFLSIRGTDGSLTTIKMTGSLSESISAAKQAGLNEGDAIEVQYVNTVKLKGGKTFFKYAVQI